jgi:membrane fusion protein, multidrug efflux system
MTRRRRIAVTLAAILGLWALYEILTTFLAYTADAYVQSDLIAVAPQVTGRIIALNVTDNQTVTRGDPLLTIDPVPFRLAVDQHQAEFDEAQAQVTVDQDQSAAAQAALASAEAADAYARENHTRIAALATAQDVARAELDEADDALRRADAALDEAKANLARTQATTTMHRAAQARAASALATARWQLEQTRLVAPADGIVTSLTTRIGDTAQADTPLIGIVDAHAWRIVANFKQSFIRGFTSGDTAWIWLDSEPWHLHRARVAGIARGISRDPAPGRLLAYVAPTTDWIRLQRRFPVTLTLVDPPPNLQLYMGADARVLILP